MSEFLLEMLKKLKGQESQVTPGIKSYWMLHDDKHRTVTISIRQTFPSSLREDKPSGHCYRFRDKCGYDALLEGSSRKEFLSSYPHMAKSLAEVWWHSRGLFGRILIICSNIHYTLHNSSLTCSHYFFNKRCMFIIFMPKEIISADFAIFCKLFVTR